MTPTAILNLAFWGLAACAELTEQAVSAHDQHHSCQNVHANLRGCWESVSRVHRQARAARPRADRLAFRSLTEKLDTIVPTAITGDMHSVNKADFAVLPWFGLRFDPRLINLEDQLQELYCVR
ncbi:hypothetical protein ABID59_007395 [Bradyrhizobium sp. S3.3.6]